MNSSQGPAIFLVQFVRDHAPFIARHLIEPTAVTFGDFVDVTYGDVTVIPRSPE